MRPLAGGAAAGKTLATYANVTSAIGVLLSTRMATLHELDTVYGMADAYNMLEVVQVDDYNKALMQQD